MEHFNKLTPAEAERLALIAEECAEVIKEVGKILRHGYESKWPKDGLTNRQKLEVEVGGLQAVLGIAIAEHDIDCLKVEEHCFDKLQTIDKWLHHQNES